MQPRCTSGCARPSRCCRRRPGRGLRVVPRPLAAGAERDRAGQAQGLGRRGGAVGRRRGGGEADGVGAWGRGSGRRLGRALAGRRGPAGLAGGRLTRGGHRLTVRRVTRAGGHVVGGPAHGGQHHHGQRRGHGQPAPSVRLGVTPRGRRRGRGHHGVDVFAGAVGLVVLADQRIGVDADGLGDGPDVAASVGVSPADREVVLLDAPDDGLADAGPAADLIDGEMGSPPRVGQSRPDPHVYLRVPRVTYAPDGGA